MESPHPDPLPIRWGEGIESNPSVLQHSHPAQSSSTIIQQNQCYSTLDSVFLGKLKRAHFKLSVERHTKPVGDKELHAGSGL